MRAPLVGWGRRAALQREAGSEGDGGAGGAALAGAQQNGDGIKDGGACGPRGEGWPRRVRVSCPALRLRAAARGLLLRWPLSLQRPRCTWGTWARARAKASWRELLWAAENRVDRQEPAGVRLRGVRRPEGC